MFKDKQILYFGRIPPPTGGVSVFNKKFTEYLKVDNSVRFFSLNAVLRKYDYSFINYSVPWKRLIATVVSKTLSRNTILVLHSSRFKKNICNSISVRLCTKVVTTSDDIATFDLIKNKAIKVESLLFKEFYKNKIYNNENKSNSFRILFYQHNNIKKDDKYIYGQDKMLKLLPDLQKSNLEFSVIWIDLSGEMKKELERFKDIVSYYDYAIDLTDKWSDIDLLIRPTIFDGTAFMIIEALLNNVKVLCSDLPSRPKYVKKIQDKEREISIDEVIETLHSTKKVDQSDLECLLPSITILLKKL